MNQYRPSKTPVLNANQSLPMNSSGKGGSGFDPELAAKIEALEKQQAPQRRCPSCGTVATTKRLTCESCGNYYERGAEETIWDAKKSGGGSTGKGGVATEDEQLIALKSYLVKRIVAKTIDIVIVSSCVVMEFMTYFAVAKSFGTVPEMATLMLGLLYWGMPILALLTVLCYQAAFEASPVQATLGKLLMGLYVVGSDGKQAATEPLVFKALISALPALGFAAVYIYFLATRMQNGMPLDAISTAVLAVTGVAFFVTFLSLHIILGPEKKRQTIPDLLTGVMVQER